MIELIVSTMPPHLSSGEVAFVTAELINGLAKAYAVLAHRRPLPPLYGGSIRYQMESNHGDGWEEYADPWTVAQRGHGDCDDLTLYRCVELLVKGEKARARGEWIGPQVHVLVRRGNGKLEDPSKRLGMQG